ncbi:MAG: aminotransferase class V-fold PLP-dependent enzyme [bacterium]|nr:aminotransferase class V-fold PLP-dependent enzyme [bacterium]MCP5070560.1 aminotransferase class V-fold PLP-dependent enzyme [bacterium]
MPASGTDWDTLREQMVDLGKGDVDWRAARTAVYVFNAGEDVLRVAKEAYALYQSENGLGPAAFPSLARMEREVIEMGLDLLQAPDGACGNMTSGGTESIFMAVKACREQARAGGRDTRGMRIVVPRSAHPAFDKAARTLDLEVQRVPVAEDWRADVQAMGEAVDDQTLMLVGSAPCFPYGLIDPIDALSDLALARDVWLHVDACVGGYFAPFARMNGVDVPPFDFELPGVRSISADLHKYGYAAKGASTVFHRTEEQREFQIFRFDDWPSGGMETPTAAGTRPGGAIAGAWAVMHYLGVEGYREKVKMVTDTREKLMRAIDAMPELQTVGSPKLGLFLYGSDQIDPYAVWGRLLKRGWFTGLVSEPRAIHLMLSPAHADVADSYLADLAEAVSEVKTSGEDAAGTRARYA